MKVVSHSELLQFLQGLNPNGEVSAEDIIVDYNGQYMYTARITHNGYHCRWECESVQPEHGNSNIGSGWGMPPYSDQRTVRTSSTDRASFNWHVSPGMVDAYTGPQIPCGGSNDNTQSVDRAGSRGSLMTVREAELYYEEQRQRDIAFAEARGRDIADFTDSLISH